MREQKTMSRRRRRKEGAQVSNPTNNSISPSSYPPPLSDITMDNHTSSPTQRPARLARVEAEEEEEGSRRRRVFDFNLLHPSRDPSGNFTCPVEFSQLLELLEEKGSEIPLHSTNSNSPLTSSSVSSLSLMNHEILGTLKAALTCPLCRNLLRFDPAIISTCGHCYCSPCINHAIERGCLPLTKAWPWKGNLSPSPENDNNEKEKEDFTGFVSDACEGKVAKKSKRLPKKVQFSCPLCLAPAFKWMLIRLPLMRELCTQLHEVLPDLERVLHDLQESTNEKTGKKNDLSTSTGKSPVILTIQGSSLTETQSKEAKASVKNSKEDNDHNDKKRTFREELTLPEVEGSRGPTFTAKNQNIEKDIGNSVSPSPQHSAFQEKEDDPMQGFSETLSKEPSNHNEVSPSSPVNNSLPLPVASANFTPCSLNLFPPPLQGKVGGIRLASPSSKAYFDTIDHEFNQNGSGETSKALLRRGYGYCEDSPLDKQPSGNIASEEEEGETACDIIENNNDPNKRSGFLAKAQFYISAIKQNQEYQQQQSSLALEVCEDSILPFLAQHSPANDADEEKGSQSNPPKANALRHGEAKIPTLATSEEREQYSQIESITSTRGIDSSITNQSADGGCFRVGKALPREDILGACSGRFSTLVMNSGLTLQSPNLPSSELGMAKMNDRGGFSESNSRCVRKKEEEERSNPSRKAMITDKEGSPDDKQMQEKTNKTFHCKSTLTQNSYSSSLSGDTISEGATPSTEQLYDNRRCMLAATPPLLSPGAYRYLLYNDTP